MKKAKAKEKQQRQGKREGKGHLRAIRGRRLSRQ